MIRSSVTYKFFLAGKYESPAGEFPLCFRAIVDRQKAEFYTKIKILPRKWSDEKQRVNATTKADLHINQIISDYESKLTTARFDIESQGIPLTAKMLVNILTGKNPKYRTYLLSYFDEHIKTISELTKEYGEPTIVQYRRVKNYLAEFLAKKGHKDIPIANFSKKYLHEFQHFLMTRVNPDSKNIMVQNTCTNYLSKLRAVFHRAYIDEVITRTPFTGLKLKEIRGTKAYLTEEEIVLLENHPLGGIGSLCRVRDFFIFCISTGLRFSDAFNLTDQQVFKDAKNRYWLRLLQEKTSEPLEIPLMERAVRVYNKYQAHREETGLVLPHLSCQKINAHLKTIADLVGINKKLSSHVGRHTCAVNLLENGVGIEVVSKLLGHVSIKTTVKAYAKITKTLLNDTADRLDKLSRKRDKKNGAGKSAS